MSANKCGESSVVLYFDFRKATNSQIARGFGLRVK